MSQAFRYPGSFGIGSFHSGETLLFTYDCKKQSIPNRNRVNRYYAAAARDLPTLIPVLPLM